MKLSNYGFDFKPELIAQYPEINRDESRLIVVHRDTGEVEHRLFKDILIKFNVYFIAVPRGLTFRRSFCKPYEQF